MIRYTADWFREKKNSSADYEKLQKNLSKKAQLPCREVGKELFANLSLEMKRILADSFLEAYTNQTEEVTEVECCDDSGHKVIFSGSVPVTEDHTASYSFCASEKKPRNCLKLWLNHLLLSAKYPEYTATVCQFEDQEFKLEAVEQKKAKAKLLQLAEIREAGKSAVVPFLDEVEPAEDVPNKNGNYPYQTKKYEDGVAKAIYFYDYCASLLFKKTDINEDFLRNVCLTVLKVYKIEEDTNE